MELELYFRKQKQILNDFFSKLVILQQQDEIIFPR